MSNHYKAVRFLGWEKKQTFCARRIKLHSLFSCCVYTHSFTKALLPVSARNMLFHSPVKKNNDMISGRKKKLEMFFQVLFCGFIWSNQVAHTSTEVAKSTPLYSQFY